MTSKLAGLLDQIEAELTKQKETRDADRAKALAEREDKNPGDLLAKHHRDRAESQATDEALHLLLALAGIEGLRTIGRIADALEVLAKRPQ